MGKASSESWAKQESYSTTKTLIAIGELMGDLFQHQKRPFKLKSLISTPALPPPPPPPKKKNCHKEQKQLNEFLWY